MGAQQIGETRTEMRNRLLTEKLHKVAGDAHREKNLDEFWIIISHREDVNLWNVIREAIVVTSMKPKHRMLNSMCFHVVWSKGIIEPVWILPRDLPVDEEVFGSDGHSGLILNNIAPLGAQMLVN